MESLWHDIKFAVRLFSRERVFTAVALLTLALCIGANTAIFSVIHSSLLEPLPYRDPGRLVALSNSYKDAVPGRMMNSTVDFYDRRELREVFEEVALFGTSGFIIGAEGAPERVPGMRVTPSFFRILEKPALAGRFFDDDEMEPGRDRVVLLGEPLWRRAYGADPNIVGRDVLLNGETHRVVGIMPASFKYLNKEAELWVVHAPAPEDRDVRNKHLNSWGMIARLRPGVSIRQARERVEVLNAAVLERTPEIREMILDAGYRTEVVDLLEATTAAVRLPLLLLQAGVAVVLVIGCVNLANLILGRANVRMRELATRFSLGASRSRVFCQLVTESVLLVFGGGAFGLLVGAWGVEVIRLLWITRLPRDVEFSVEWPVLLFTVVMSAVTGLAAGSLPAMQVARTNLATVMKQGARTSLTGHGSAGLRNALVVVQVALAFVLLIGAGLLIRSFQAVLAVNPGFRAEGVQSAGISLPKVRYDSNDKVTAFHDELRERAGRIPGVSSAGLAAHVPFGQSMQQSLVSVEGEGPISFADTAVPIWNFVDRGYFETLGIPLFAGRLFEETDAADRPIVAVIDSVLVDRYWPGQNPVGRTIIENLGIEKEDRRMTVVDVVGKLRAYDLTDPELNGAIYLSLRQDPAHRFSIVMRMAEGSAPAYRSLQEAVLRVDAQIPIFDQMALVERMAGSVSGRRVPMILLQSFAGIALFLAAIGVYGVLAYSVAQRRWEIGIRLAIGAQWDEVVAMIFRRGITLVAIGLAIGVLLAAGLTRVLASMLFETSRLDLVTLVAVLVIVAIVGAVACVILAARAARVSPLEILRDE